METYYISRTEDDWIVSAESGARPLGAFGSREEAVEATVVLPGDREGRIFIHCTDGGGDEELHLLSESAALQPHG